MIIPAAIKDKLTPSSTDTLVYMLYLQWAYMVTFIVIMNLSRELVGDWASFFPWLEEVCLLFSCTGSLGSEGRRTWTRR